MAIPEPLRPVMRRYLKARERVLADKGMLDAKPLICPLDDPNAFYSSNHLRRAKRIVAERSGVRF